MATAEVKKLWGIAGVVLVVVVALLALAVVQGGKTTAIEPLTLTQPVGVGDWTVGSATSSVTVVEYSDFQCPACASYAPVVGQLISEYGDRISFTYRHYPLRSIHPNAQLAGQAAEAAGKQGQFWQMADLLFTNQNEWGSRPQARDNFVAYAERLGLNMAQFQSDMDSAAAKQEVDRDFQSGAEAGVNHTPTFFVNGTEIQNPRSYEEFAGIIEDALTALPAPTNATSSAIVQ